MVVFVDPSQAPVAVAVAVAVAVPVAVGACMKHVLFILCAHMTRSRPQRMIIIGI